MELDGPDKREVLWELAMHDLQCGDYYISRSSSSNGSTNKDNGGSTTNSEAAAVERSSMKNNNNRRPTKRARTNPTAAAAAAITRRSVRLKPTSPKEQYIHAYNLLLARNESALLELTEHAQQSSSSYNTNNNNKKRLSPSIIKKIIIEYGPIAINRRVQTGGTYLVEIIRARNVHESVILKCCKLVIEMYGANPNIPSAEMIAGRANNLNSVETTTVVSNTASSSSLSQQSSLKSAGTKKREVVSAIVVGSSSNSTTRCGCQTSSTGKELYPLIIASARGMSSVVQYLLTSGANPSVKGSSKFRLYANPRKCIKGIDLTALQFARRMKEMEIENGCKLVDLRGLLRTISILENA
jgi:hypothetical protein